MTGLFPSRRNGAPTTYSDFENYVAAVSAWKEQVAQVISVYQKQVADADGAYDADTSSDCNLPHCLSDLF